MRSLWGLDLSWTKMSSSPWMWMSLDRRSVHRVRARRLGSWRKSLPLLILQQFPLRGWPVWAPGFLPSTICKLVELLLFESKIFTFSRCWRRRVTSANHAIVWANTLVSDARSVSVMTTWKGRDSSMRRAKLCLVLSVTMTLKRPRTSAWAVSFVQPLYKTLRNKLTCSFLFFLSTIPQVWSTGSWKRWWRVWRWLCWWSRLWWIQWIWGLVWRRWWWRRRWWWWWWVSALFCHFHIFWKGTGC